MSLLRLGKKKNLALAFLLASPYSVVGVRGARCYVVANLYKEAHTVKEDMPSRSQEGPKSPTIPSQLL